MEICILLNARFLTPNVTYVIADDNYCLLVLFGQ